ncbi:uncharacterized protein V6R79_018084 [Siganus canaliculatus]
MAVQGVFFWMQVCLLLQLGLSLGQHAEAEAKRNYYDVLNVEPTATDRQIKKSFRKLAIKYHPDKNKSADAEKTFREIAEAYKVLSNKEERKLYDSMGHEAFLRKDTATDPEAEHDSPFHFTFTDLFHDFDDSPFEEEMFVHWSHHQDEEGDFPYKHFSFDPGFSFYFGDMDEDEDVYL